jgi:hypothetical protein
MCTHNELDYTPFIGRKRRRMICSWMKMMMRTCWWHITFSSKKLPTLIGGVT